MVLRTGPRALLASLLAIFLASHAIAQTNQLSDSRYLLIFDTSAGMKRRSENVQRVAGDLLYSGMNGQMRPGDSIGVWTFNESVAAGKFPMLRWAPAQRTSIAGRVAEFVRNQKFEKESRLDAILPAVFRLVTNSPKLTVIIFSDGISTWAGTPFDAGINAAYVPFRETQRRERMPFVTVLRSLGGEFIGHAVTPAPWVVEFPQFPPEPVVEAPKVEPKPEPVRRTVPPLIVIGNKDTNAAPAMPLPQPGTESKLEAKPGQTEAEKLFAKLAAEQGVDLPPDFGATNAGTPSQPPGSAPAPLVTETQRLTPPPTVQVETKSAIVIQPAASEATNLPPAAAQIASAHANPAPSTPASPAEVQAIAPPLDHRNGRILLIGGGVSLLVIALGVTYALMRRRHRAHVSLITRSMGRRDR